MSKQIVSFQVDDNYQLQATLVEGEPGETLVYESLDTDLLQVDETGLVTPGPIAYRAVGEIGVILIKTSLGRELSHEFFLLSESDGNPSTVLGEAESLDAEPEFVVAVTLADPGTRVRVKNDSDDVVYEVDVAPQGFARLVIPVAEVAQGTGADRVVAPKIERIRDNQAVQVRLDLRRENVAGKDRAESALPNEVRDVLLVPLSAPTTTTTTSTTTTTTTTTTTAAPLASKFIFESMKDPNGTLGYVAINELQIIDQDGNLVPYTVTASDVRDTGNNGVPVYWNTSTYDKSNLNDGVTTGTNNTDMTLLSGRGRFMLDLGNYVYESLTFKVWIGGSLVNSQNWKGQVMRILAVHGTYNKAQHIDAFSNTDLALAVEDTAMLAKYTTTPTAVVLGSYPVGQPSPAWQVVSNGGFTQTVKTDGTYVEGDNFGPQTGWHGPTIRHSFAPMGDFNIDIPIEWDSRPGGTVGQLQFRVKTADGVGMIGRAMIADQASATDSGFLYTYKAETDSFAQAAFAGLRTGTLTIRRVGTTLTFYFNGTLMATKTAVSGAQASILDVSFETSNNVPPCVMKVGVAPTVTAP